jgi:hypothetical protein
MMSQESLLPSVVDGSLVLTGALLWWWRSHLASFPLDDANKEELHGYCIGDHFAIFFAYSMSLLFHFILWINVWFNNNVGTFMYREHWFILYCAGVVVSFATLVRSFEISKEYYLRLSLIELKKAYAIDYATFYTHCKKYNYSELALVRVKRWVELNRREQEEDPALMKRLSEYLVSLETYKQFAQQLNVY